MTNKEDIIGKWSQEKIKLLGKYLSAYLDILSKQLWCKGYEYIDAFAGTGKPKSKDEQSYIDGSPRVALKLSKPFTQYHFVEQSDWRADKLNDLKCEFKDRSIAIYQGDCNKVILEQILPQLSYSSKKRAIAFIDPFGMEMQWETMKKIAETKAIEIILNFPTMAINRGILRKHPDLITEKNRERMNQFWGTNDWMVDLYEEEQTLFGPELTKKKQSAKEFGMVFKKRLEQIFGHCTFPVLMKNSNNAPLYCIMFAGHNKTGAKIASDIFRKYEESNQ